MKMTNAEKEYVAEMNRLREAIKKTNSEYLKADYSKALKRMKRELKEYRRFRSGEQPLLFLKKIIFFKKTIDII